MTLFRISFESVSRPKEVKSEIKALYIISKNAGLPLFQKELDESKKIDPNFANRHAEQLFWKSVA